jgi:aspartate/glutamate racemase
MAQPIGIVAGSAEGAALCYPTICLEGVDRLGPHNHAEISIDSHAFAEDLNCIGANGATGSSSTGWSRENSWLGTLANCIEMTRGPKEAGCDAVILSCREIPLLRSPEAAPLPTLDSTRILARAALRKAVED